MLNSFKNSDGKLDTLDGFDTRILECCSSVATSDTCELNRERHSLIKLKLIRIYTFRFSPNTTSSTYYATFFENFSALISLSVLYICIDVNEDDSGEVFDDFALDTHGI